MTDVSVQNAAEAIDKWAAKLVGVVEQHGPAVADLALTVGRVGAAQTIAQGVGLALAALATGAIALKIAPRVAQAWVDIDDPMIAVGGGISTIALTLACVASSIGAFPLLANFYAWVGLWRPEIYLAAKALGL